MTHALAECVTSRRARCLRAPSPAARVTRRLCVPLTPLCPAPPRLPVTATSLIPCCVRYLRSRSVCPLP